MKILHLIYSQQMAGAEKHLLVLLPGLQQKGVECHVICVTPPGDASKFTRFRDELNDKGVKATLLPGSIKQFIAVARSINRYLRSNNIGIIHTHLFKSDLLGVMVKKIFNKKLVLLSTRHGYEEKYFNNYPEHKGKIIYNNYYFISRYVLGKMDAHLAVSKAMSDLYYGLKLTKERAAFVHHGIEPIARLHTDEAVAYRRAPQQLVVVGRIETVKGHRYLFEAMPAVIREFPEVKLLILGNGTEKENLENKANTLGIRDHIDFLGFQPEPHAFIANSDIIIQPSLYESFGLVFIEAFSLKTLMIAFDVPAGNEIVAHNENGLLVPPFDTGILAEQIIRMLKDPGERKRLAENAYSNYCVNFTAERMVTETKAWYQGLEKIKKPG